ncbi:MAG: CbtB-domain containing protein [Methylococcaceae bacterium]|nr:CbtB-domain containing protein [Methylococcaceae bacterium]
MIQFSQTQEVSSVNTRKSSQILASVVLGVVVLSAVGVAPLEVIHNAAHDTRHSSGFPCH